MPLVITVLVKPKYWRPKVELPLEGRAITWVRPFHADDRRICGEVFVVPEVPNSRTEHGGITIQLIGVTEFLHNHNQDHAFLSIDCPFSGPGEFDGIARFPFIIFLDEPLPIETVHGENVKVRYLLRVTFTNRDGGNIVKDQEIVVHKFRTPGPLDNGPAVPLEYGNWLNFYARVEFEDRGYNLKEDVTFPLRFVPENLIWKITRGAYVQLVRLEHNYGAAPMRPTRKVISSLFVETGEAGGIDTLVTIPLSRLNKIPPSSWLLDGRPIIEYYVNIVFNTSNGPKRWGNLLLTLIRVLPN